ncbi:hypothetical protein [Escherichia sp. E13S3]|uniref:hypothetical protein n=1 Tax=Escherichia sp. E13S3 TaxID=2484854 RepID=UPI0010292022|nr:hypothetical protein [Escherichia sp. E13S3]RZN51508.1 hypothetical protein D9597_04475 [Escherichia sp. E13S3]
MAHSIKQCFHAVGKGTLYTGQIKNMSGNSTFNIVYDCGSTSRTTIINKIHSLPKWFKNTPGSRVIDMLVISHFDDDHVNGLEELLRLYRVKKLVLPYTEWTQSVREIAVLGKKGVSPSVALFQLNPLRWLQMNNLNGSVEQLTLVQGDAPPDDNHEEPNSPPRYPLNADFNNLNFQNNEREAIQQIDLFGEEGAFLKFKSSGNQTGPVIRTIDHAVPLYSTDSAYEFMFYNVVKSFKGLGLVRVQSGEICALKSEVPLKDVKAEIELLIDSLGLTNDISSLPPDWRKKLKACYQKHFGHTAKAKNNISLCMYVGRTINSIIDSMAQHATLLTGDINLTRDVACDMLDHFGPRRKKSISVIQVPHHGSRDYWSAENANLFVPAIFVQCVTPSKNHPHPDVTLDIEKTGCTVQYANRISEYNF